MWLLLTLLISYVRINLDISGHRLYILTQVAIVSTHLLAPPPLMGRLMTMSNCLLAKISAKWRSSPLMSSGVVLSNVHCTDSTCNNEVGERGYTYIRDIYIYRSQRQGQPGQSQRHLQLESIVCLEHIIKISLAIYGLIFHVYCTTHNKTKGEKKIDRHLQGTVVLL